MKNLLHSQIEKKGEINMKSIETQVNLQSRVSRVQHRYGLALSMFLEVLKSKNITTSQDYEIHDDNVEDNVARGFGAIVVTTNIIDSKLLYKQQFSYSVDINDIDVLRNNIVHVYNSNEYVSNTDFAVFHLDDFAGDTSMMARNYNYLKIGGCDVQKEYVWEFENIDIIDNDGNVIDINTLMNHLTKLEYNSDIDDLVSECNFNTDLSKSVEYGEDIINKLIADFILVK